MSTEGRGTSSQFEQPIQGAYAAPLSCSHDVICITRLPFMWTGTRVLTDSGQAQRAESADAANHVTSGKGRSRAPLRPSLGHQTAANVGAQVQFTGGAYERQRCA